VGELEKNKLNSVAVQEVRWEGEGYQAAEEINAENTKYMIMSRH
jgi:hypothetical protein